MSVMFVVFSIFGYLWSFYLKKLKKKREELEAVDPRKDQNKTFRAFDELVTDFNSSFDSKLKKLQDHHLLQRELLGKDRRGWSAIDHQAKTGELNDSVRWKNKSNRMIRPALKALHVNVVVPVTVKAAEGDNSSPHKDETMVELFQSSEFTGDELDQIDSEQQTSLNDVEDIGDGNGRVVSPDATPRNEDEVATETKENKQHEETPIEEFEEVLEL